MHQPVEAPAGADPQTQAPQLPLSQFKVIDLTLARAGPSCVRTLADWGADVIRVEPPPEAAEASEVVGRRDGSDFENVHRNKRGITIDFKKDAGREILMRLAERPTWSSKIPPRRHKAARRRFRDGEGSATRGSSMPASPVTARTALTIPALDRPDRAGHDGHDVGDRISRSGPAAGRRRGHRHHGWRLSGTRAS